MIKHSEHLKRAFENMLEADEIRMTRLFNALSQSNQGHCFDDFIDDDDLIQCVELLVKSFFDEKFIDEWVYDDSVYK